ncbi:hypothetical protein M885DRAFT_610604, partial [Pelagophyceae sp. CCMP2097]
KKSPRAVDQAPHHHAAPEAVERRHRGRRRGPGVAGRPFRRARVEEAAEERGRRPEVAHEQEPAEDEIHAEAVRRRGDHGAKRRRARLARRPDAEEGQVVAVVRADALRAPILWGLQPGHGGRREAVRRLVRRPPHAGQARGHGARGRHGPVPILHLAEEKIQGWRRRRAELTGNAASLVLCVKPL